MPYKDQKKRRTHQCEYKRRQRAMGKMSNPVSNHVKPIEVLSNLESNHEKKAYLYPKVPNLRLRGIVFKNGFFVTDRPDEQDRIESAPLYGKEVFSWVVDP